MSLSEASEDSSDNDDSSDNESCERPCEQYGCKREGNEETQCCGVWLCSRHMEELGFRGCHVPDCSDAVCSTCWKSGNRSCEH